MQYVLIGLALVLVIGVFWFLMYLGRNTESPEDDDSAPLAIVAMLAEPQRMEPIYIVNAAKKAWGADLGTGLGGDGDEGEDGFVVGNEGVPTIVVSYRERMMIVNFFDSPYFDDPEEVADQIGDLRLRDRVARHRAWLSVDAINSDDPDDAEVRETYQRLGRLMAELIDDNCLALLFPRESRIFPIQEDTLDLLQANDPLLMLGEEAPVPVVPIADDDPRMLAAVQKARRQFPEFVGAFERKQGESFSVKAPITRGGNTEFIWLTVTAIENDVIYGELANEPVDLGDLNLGSRVKTTVSELNDWAYYHRESLQGGFTIKVVTEAFEEPPPDSRA